VFSVFGAKDVPCWQDTERSDVCGLFSNGNSRQGSNGITPLKDLAFMAIKMYIVVIYGMTRYSLMFQCFSYLRITLHAGNAEERYLNRYMSVAVPLFNMQAS
jgi:hypothetical protein